MKTTISRTFLMVAGLAVTCASASAGLVTDQNQPLSDVPTLASFEQRDIAQSFKQTHDNIAGAGILLSTEWGIKDTVTISVWSDLPTRGGKWLAQAIMPDSIKGSWVDVFWDPIAVDPKDTLYLVFSGNTTLGIAGHVHNPYASGMAYSRTGAAPSSTDAPSYQEFSNYDYTFRTYSVVPEPSTYLAGLGAFGMLGMFGWRNRK